MADVNTKREIVVGITGGVAAYKSAMLVSRLVQAGIGVTVVTTPAAEQFIGSAALAALAGRPVARELFDPAFPLGAHISLAERGELLIIAPASADFMAKAAHGLADDLLSTLYLAFTGPVLMAPAMNTAMWNHVAVQRNVQRLRDDGVQFIDPESGWLSCRQQGAGRMAAWEEIAAAVQTRLDTLPPGGA
ncbi:flavoprotein [Anatilimnocola sp. NA78]|uniref:flavoprotein n=1 Tax=Anatilimnocola sp. NA78 TaxID=3415683 RepID=UPI003CE46930